MTIGVIFISWAHPRKFFRFEEDTMARERAKQAPKGSQQLSKTSVMDLNLWEAESLNW